MNVVDEYDTSRAKFIKKGLYRLSELNLKNKIDCKWTTYLQLKTTFHQHRECHFPNAFPWQKERGKKREPPKRRRVRKKSERKGLGEEEEKKEDEEEGTRRIGTLA